MRLVAAILVCSHLLFTGKLQGEERPLLIIFYSAYIYLVQTITRKCISLYGGQSTQVDPYKKHMPLIHSRSRPELFFVYQSLKNGCMRKPSQIRNEPIRMGAISLSPDSKFLISNLLKNKILGIKINTLPSFSHGFPVFERDPLPRNIRITGIHM